MRRSFVDTVLGQWHVVREGHGPQVLLLPAASQSHNAVRRLARALTTRFDVTVLDLPGSGYSGPLPPGTRFEDLADAVHCAIGALGLDRPCVYGIHTGNKIAASLAARHPASVSGVVLCGQTHSLVMDQALRTHGMRAISAKRHRSSAQHPGAQLQQRLALWHEVQALWWREDPPALDLPSEELLERRLVVADFLLSLDSLAAMYEANFAYDFESDLRRLLVPALVVEIATPREDEIFGRQGPAVVQAAPDVRLLTYEEPDGLGLTLEGRADALANAIADFIQRRGQASLSSTTTITSP